MATQTSDRLRYPEDHWARREVSEQSLQRYLAQNAVPYNRTKWRIFKRLLGSNLWGQTVLDYGGGAGYLSVWCAEKGGRVTLVDAEANALGTARLLAEKRGVSNRLETIQSESFPASIADRRYHTIILKDVIEHVPEDGALLRALAGCHEPGGQLLLCTQSRFCLNYLLEGTYHRRWLHERDWCGWDNTHLRFYTPRSLRRLVTQAGYRIRRWWGTFIVPYNLLSWLTLLRRDIELPALHRLDLWLGGVFPFNRWGWTVIVAAERRAE
ncbi:MAG: class I SAM-dependent methyltransferase [Gemmatimonadetes bacterium]|nr:class I SAM-dependent methyltransferase [Gemmatimonadota bacterium]